MGILIEMGADAKGMGPGLLAHDEAACHVNNTLHENDLVALSKAANAEVIGQSRKVMLPAGTVATVVAVYGDPDHPSAYEVEAYLEVEDRYALATIDVGPF